jgi:imelysin
VLHGSFYPMRLALLRSVAALLGCTVAALLLAEPANSAAPKTSPPGHDVKSYLLETLNKIDTAADQFVQDASAYTAIVAANGGDPVRAFAAAPEDVRRLVEALREGYKAMDSFGYETIEGIVAGVPALADFDVYLDAGVPQDQAGGGTPVAPVVITLPGGGKLDHQGCLFTYLVEPMLWGSNKSLVVPADLNGDGQIAAHESLPRPEMLQAIATDLRAKLHELHDAAAAWQPSTSDYFSAIIAMTPTLSGYFDDWKESRYAPEASGKFNAVSRVSDMRGIMFSIAVMFDAVRPEVASKDPALANSIKRGFDGILSFIDRVDRREKKSGGAMTPAEVDELGEQAKQKADKLVPQVEQAAAIIDIKTTA